MISLPQLGQEGPPVHGHAVQESLTLCPLQVTNGAELAEALQDVGRNLGLKVRPYTVTPRAPLASYVAAMARSGVLVARHGPLLANAVFLPPGTPWILPYRQAPWCAGRPDYLSQVHMAA